MTYVCTTRNTFFIAKHKYNKAMQDHKTNFENRAPIKKKKENT